MKRTILILITLLLLPAVADAPERWTTTMDEIIYRNSGREEPGRKPGWW